MTEIEQLEQQAQELRDEIDRTHLKLMEVDAKIKELSK